LIEELVQLLHLAVSQGIHFQTLGYVLLIGDKIESRMSAHLLPRKIASPEFPEHPLYNGNPWFLPLVGGYYRLRD
jgi:hypothetical protein